MPYGDEPDPVRDAGFPSVDQLRRGIVLNCIAHSFWLVAHPPVSEMWWWDGGHYEDTIQGERWAVAFSDRGAVAVFYSSESSRNPFPEGRPRYDQASYFQGMPECLAAAKDDALSAMHDLNYQGDNPQGAVITAAMWADGEKFTAAESWETVYDHSLWACRTHLLPPTAAANEWLQGIDPRGSAERAALSIFERRLSSRDETIELQAWELQTFIETAGPQIDSMKWSAAHWLLADVGVALPKPIEVQ